MIAGALIGAFIGFLIWATANKGHFEGPDTWVQTGFMNAFKGIAIMIILAAIGAGIGSVMQ